MASARRARGYNTRKDLGVLVASLIGECNMHKKVRSTDGGPTQADVCGRPRAPVYCLGHTASPGIVRDPSLQALRHHVAWLAELDNEPRQPEDERRHRDEEHAQGELLPSASRAEGVEEVATEEEGHAVQDVLQDGQLAQALRGASAERGLHRR